MRLPRLLLIRKKEDMKKASRSDRIPSQEA